ncbi:MAG: U32 family peptidase [Firmicutes bacterium]|nr:U32 family peptidase [Bacillota bacterium]
MTGIKQRGFMLELLAPAGDIEKLKTAIHFGADAVYFAGKSFGLRAFSANFDADGLKSAVDFTHSKNKKAYITVNIFAKNSDFGELKEYIQILQAIKADAVIVSDPGVIAFVKTHAPALKIHLSTQANTTNKYSAAFWADYVERIVLARELSLAEITEIKNFVPQLTLEAFVHGAMCISYSGRCLLSDYMSVYSARSPKPREANRGECVQVCRFPFTLTEEESGQKLSLYEDGRGSYILNSRDLNMLPHLDKLVQAGISSFKIEGRAKSAYYVGGAVNAYRRGIDLYSAALKKKKPYVCPPDLVESLNKISHRKYTTAFYFNDLSDLKDTTGGQNMHGNDIEKQCYDSSRATGTHDFAAIVIKKKPDGIIVEQRNKFVKGDTLEVLSPGGSNGKSLKLTQLFSALTSEKIEVANKVQEKIFIPTDLALAPNDLLIKAH